MIPSAKIILLERAPNIMSVFILQHIVSTLEQCILPCGYFGMAPISRPPLFLEALPCNIGVLSLVTLLSSHHGKINLSLGTFSYL